ncbi:MAG TPA: ABC transporter permease, partial [Bacteroidales bacterium]|nr:ABC transporter permease [Bacteroidales bacterium]
MLKSFIVLAVRNLFRNRTTSLINILGFSLGITCCLVIYFKVKFELSFDRFHTNYEKTYRIVRQTKGLGLNLAPGEWEYREGVFGALPGAVKKNIPEVKELTAVMDLGPGQIIKIPDPANASVGKALRFDGRAAMVEPSYLRIFDFAKTGFRWIAGDANTALNEAFSVVLTESEAKKLFQDTNPVGRTVTLFDKVDFTVTGIISDVPINTDFPFAMLISYSTIDKLNPGFSESWNNLGGNQCFVVLGDASQVKMVEAKIKGLYAQHGSKEEVENRIFKLQPLKEIHSDDRFQNFSDRIVSSNIIFALMCVGIFIIVIASINYANLALARSGLRTREVGIRKVFGSSRSMIIGQFLGESFVITLIAMNIGLVCARIILSLSPGYIEIPSSFPLNFDITTWSFVLMLIVVLSLISGGYPAFVISNFRPIEILKAKMFISQRGKLNFTRSMVVLQFTISLTMIIATIVVIKQLHFLNNIDLGYNKHDVFSVNIPEEDMAKLDRFKSTLLRNPNIKSVSVNKNDPARSGNWTDLARIENKEVNQIVIQLVAIDTSYLETFQLSLVAGRNVSNIDSGKTVVVNQQLVKDFGYTSDLEAVGTEAYLYGPHGVKVTIVGVVRDYFYETLKNKVRPTALIGKPEWAENAGIKIAAAANRKEVLQYTQDTWLSVYPDRIYEYTFLEDRLESYYKHEHLTSQLFNIFSVIAIVIGCLGILIKVSCTISSAMSNRFTYVFA